MSINLLYRGAKKPTRCSKKDWNDKLETFLIPEIPDDCRMELEVVLAPRHLDNPLPVHDERLSPRWASLQTVLAPRCDCCHHGHKRSSTRESSIWIFDGSWIFAEAEIDSQIIDSLQKVESEHCLLSAFYSFCTLVYCYRVYTKHQYYGSVLSLYDQVPGSPFVNPIGGSTNLCGECRRRRREDDADSNDSAATSRCSDR